MGPVPRAAKVTAADPEFFATVEKAVGPDIPEDFPDKYGSDLERVDVFNSSILWDIDEVVKWEARYGIEMEPGPREVFENYLARDYAIFGTLVGHPEVRNPERFGQCSVSLQRGIIVMSQGRETLSLRSYFHSANDDGDFANFAPSAGVTFSFETSELWYPLELTGLMPEPRSFLELDVLTAEPLEADLSDRLQHANGARLESTAKVELGGETFYAARLSTRLDVEGQPVVPDLQFAVNGEAAGD